MKTQDEKFNLLKSNSTKIYPQKNDSFFKKIYQDKKELISLCKGLKGIKNINEEDLQVTTLKENNAIYVQIRNDLSFIIGSNIYFYEQQSYLNPNMPVRHGSYYFNTLSEIFGNAVFHSKTMKKIPRPILITFTNGNPKGVAREITKLSDMFLETSQKETSYGQIKINGRKQNYIEVYVEAIYLNHPDNAELLNKIPSLKGFAFFTQAVKTYQEQELSKNEAVEKAIDDTIKQGLLVNLLKKEREGVKSMIISQITSEEWATFKHQEGFAEGKSEGLLEGILEGRVEGLVEGRAKGLAEGRVEGRAEGLEDGKTQVAIALLDILDDETIALKTDLSTEKIALLRQEYSKI
ncbi:hypothetical protein AN641_06795 [Candidatus Epulonipiscioides gigas]|nr:hypothetical protein AN641_06795 [Epulopiscium sp. SCG-C07WGA-EpuloA2]